MSKTKFMERRSPSNISQYHLISAAAGGLLGVTAALLLAPKSGHRLRRQISRAFVDLSEKGQDFAEDVLEKGQEAASSAADYAGSFTNSAANLIRKKVSGRPDHSTSNLVIGAISGGILGAATALMLAHREEAAEEGFTQRLKEAGKSAKENLQSINWVDTARDFMDTIKHKVYPNHNGAHYSEEETEEHHGIQDLFELASLGFRLWQNVKKKR